MKHLALRWILRFTAFAMIHGGAVHASEATLCHSFEEVYFSCQARGKIISLCASGNISPSNGYVQYRFGNAGHIELEYPDEPWPPGNRFLIDDISMGSVNATHVEFKSGGYRYVIYQGLSSGLYVKKNGKLVAKKNCEPGIYQRLSQRAYRGIKTAMPGDDVDH